MKSSKLRHAWTFFLEATELKVARGGSGFFVFFGTSVDGCTYIYIYNSMIKTRKVSFFAPTKSPPCEVELEHSRFSGKKKILVDGKLVFSTTAKQLSWCWEHPDRKATIKLDSDNGRHSLRCEEPEKPSQISMALESQAAAGERKTRTDSVFKKTTR